MCTDSLKTVSSVRLHCNSRPVNYTFNSLTKYKEAIIRKTVAHAIAICLSKQYFRIISRNDYNQMPALRGMIQRFCTPTSCFSFRARVQGWTISFVFNSVKKRKRKKKKNPDRISGSTQSGKFDKQDKHDFEFLNLVNNQNRVEYSMTLVSWGKRFTSRRKEVRFVRAHRRIHAFTVSFSFTYNGLFTDWNT